DILSRITCCIPIPVATATSIMITLIATATTAILIIGAETLLLYFLETANRCAIKYDIFTLMKTKIILKNTVLFFAVILFTALNFVCNAQNKSKVESQKSNGYETEIQTGADQTAQYLPLLKDKKVGVLTNQTGIIELWESGKAISRSQNGCGSETETAMEKVT